eukprot:403356717
MLLFVISSIRCQTAIVDAPVNKRALFVKSSTDYQFAYKIDSPLDFIQNDYGFYTYWFRIVGSELKDGYSMFQWINYDDYVNIWWVQAKRLMILRQDSQTYLCMTEYENVENARLQIKDGWNHTVTWYFSVNMRIVTYDGAFSSNHPFYIYFMRNILFKDLSSTIKMGEMQFFYIKPEELPKIRDILERYVGYRSIYQKYFPSVMDTYSLTWGKTSQYDNKGKYLDAKWKDWKDKDRFLDLVSERVWWDEAESALNLCNATQRYNQGSNICVDCELPCLECSFFSESKCFSCVVGYTLVGYKCIPSDCPRGQYFDSPSQTCKVCVDPCSSCSDATNCLYCDTGYLYIDDGSGVCVPNTQGCSAGTYLDPSGLRICKKCSSGCKNCDSQIKCTQCQSQYLLYQDQCYMDQCPSGSMNDGLEISCLNCADSNCIACTTKECLQCKSGTFLSNKKCETSCPDGFYADSTSRSCMKCQSDCLKCSGNNYTCSSCSAQTYLFGTSCVKECPKKLYFQDEAARECKLCDVKCEMCSNNKDDCGQCSQGNYLYQRKCDSICPVSFYLQEETRMCYPCHSLCQDCYGSLSTQCTKCATGFFLKETTCLDACPQPYFTDSVLQICDLCKYFCDECTSGQNCQVCLPGYQPIPNNCSGEYYLRGKSEKYLSLPYNIDQLGPGEDPKQMTVEIWFKPENIYSINLEVILSLGPYKLRKRQNEASIHLSYQGQLVYCDTATSNKPLYSQLWYHFAWSMDENFLSLKCYLNGESIGVGTSPTQIITQNILRPSEIIIGGTANPKVPETSFRGYFKELRIWKILRSAFQINYLKNVDVASWETFMYAYWKFDEKNDGTIKYFKDSSYKGLQNFDPKTVDATYTVQKIVEMTEIDLKVCKEGFYPVYVDEGSYYTCSKCNTACKNCKGPNSNDCVECTEPYKLIQAEFICKIIESCPEGQFKDLITGLCDTCDPGCKTCIESGSFCQQCRANYFREFQGTSCVDTCPFGMYGDYQKQNCYFNPLISYITPLNGTVYSYGTFIDLESQFSVLNNEPNDTYIYGWIIMDMRNQIDVSQDIVKTFYQKDQTKVHLDQNIIRANRDYNITFYVQGDQQRYNRLYSTSTNQIYIGSPPKNGRCRVSPIIGIASITPFIISQQNWLDEEPIERYEFSYSIDGGDIYIPMSDELLTNPNFTYTFDSTYNQYTEVKIKCKATNARGFSNQVLNTISLEKRSSADSSKDLEDLQLTASLSEIQVLQKLQQVNLIAQNLGQLKVNDPLQFDPKVEVFQCTASTCNNRGNCTYLYYTKKYYCSCKAPFGGQNCSFDDGSQIDLIKKTVSDIASIYNGMQDKQFEFEFLKLSTTYKEVMSESTYQIILSIITFKVQQWKDKPQTQDDLSSFMIILSNMLEFIEYELIKNNVTNQWNYDSQNAIDIQEHIQSTLSLFDRIRDNSLKQLSMVTTSQQFITRMVTYKQMLLSQESLMTLSASNFTKKNLRTFIKLSPSNFLGASFDLEQQFAIEVIEYAVNPYQLQNVQHISNNVFSVKIYNSSTFDEVKISNMQNGFEIYFPNIDSQNLTDFAKEYNSLSPYKAAQNLKRTKMLNSSSLACNYWNGNKWENSGCFFNGIDKTHIKCLCNHLTSFAPQFLTPPAYTTKDESLPNKYENSENIEKGTITKKDLLVPFNKYFDNLEELLQHKTPKPIDLIFKPGTYVVLMFWFMYISSLVYYSGRDRRRRGKMTKKQIREDLAEIKDKRIQQVQEVMQDLLLRDAMNAKKRPKQKSSQNLNMHTSFGKINDDSTILDATSKTLIHDQSFSSPDNRRIAAQNHRRISAIFNLGSIGPQNEASDTDLRLNLSQINTDSQQQSFTQVRQLSDLSKDELKELKRRAKRKVFGRVGTFSERANRFYKRTNKRHNPFQNNKMEFFNEALKATLWMGLLAKTSKIAPRHARLALLYLYISVHLLITSTAFVLGYIDTFAEMIGDSLFSTLGAAILTLMAAWVVCIPVALIFRMPMSLRRQIEGVRTKKINVVFREIDAQMSCRYAIGYFICYLFYLMMTIVVTFFNFFYPSDYCIQWFYLIFVLYILDLLMFTFAFAGLQLLLSLLANKVPCLYQMWAFFEKVRYIKNLKG